MSSEVNATHDRALRSWVASANAPEADFPIQNLPFGVFRAKGSQQPPRCGVAIGDRILDVGACTDVFEGLARDAAQACRDTHLNALMALGNATASALRAQMSALLAQGNAEGPARLGGALHATDACELLLPVRIGGYTDFFASVHHATNAGRLFRPDMPLLPNYKYVPVAYNGRANSIRLGGTPVRRPWGQVKPPEATARPSSRRDGSTTRWSSGSTSARPRGRTSRWRSAVPGNTCSASAS